jgi:Lipopolysaccharide-assembly
MREIHPDVAAGITSCIRVAAIAVMALISACATPPLVVKIDPSFALDQVRSVYVLPFASPDDHRYAERIMTQALREQLQADGIFRVVDQPGLADAYVQGTVEKWVHGGLDLSGTRPTKIGGSLTFLDPTKRHLWSVVAEQWDPLRLLADGLFARDPSALAPHWVRMVLQQLPGYTRKMRPGMADLSAGSRLRLRPHLGWPGAAPPGRGDAYSASGLGWNPMYGSKRPLRTYAPGER